MTDDEDRAPPRRWRRLAGGLAAVAIVALLVASPARAWVEPFLVWVGELGPWGPVLLAAAYIPATLLFVPGAALTVGAGALFGLGVGTVTVSIGSTAGSTMAFLIGRYAVRARIAQRVETSPRLRALDRAVAERGFRIVLLTRLSPLFPYNLLGYVYGASRVRLRDYVLASWIGMVPGTVVYVAIGHAGRELATAGAAGSTTRSPLEWTLLAVGVAATIAVTVVIARVARQALEEATAEESGPAPT